MSRKFWQFKNEVESDGAKLILEGVIASETWWGDEVTPKMFRDELKKFEGKDLTVAINSPGGDVFAGVSIYNALAEFNGNVTVEITGLAASMASLIAMAGDKIVMLPGSMLMVHKPWSIVIGDINDFAKEIEVLETIEDSLVPIYAKRSGQTEEKVQELLDAETWMTAEEAVELGFADEAIESKAKTSEAVQNAFKGRLAIQMAVKDSMEDLSKKMAAKNVMTGDPGEELPVGNPDESVTTTEVTEEVTSVEEDKPEMTPEEIAAKEAEEKAKAQAAAQPQVAVAQAQVLEPQAQAKVTETAKQSMKEYLDSKEAMEDFANILQAEAGNTSDDVRAAWKDHLEAKMGVTNPSILLPTALITEIQDAFNTGGEIWSRMFKTGVDVFRAAWDTVTGEASRAKGYNRDEEDEKAEEDITIADRVLEPQFVYKYITLAKEDIKKQRSTGALVQYVLTELPRRIVREIERAAIIGDGRADNTDFKISSYLSLKDDAEDSAVFVETYTPETGESKYDTLLLARDLIEAEGGVVLIAKKGWKSSMLLERNEAGQLLFAPGANLESLMSLEAIIEPDWFTDATDAENDAYLVVLSNYKTVGDTSIESYTNFILKSNKQEYLQELYTGGALTVRKSAVAIQAPGS